MAESEACPRCGSAATLPIAYGMPTFELGAEARAGRVELGGCVLDPGMPTRRCRRCGHGWSAASRPVDAPPAPATRTVAAVICADWAKHASKRAVWMACIDTRRITPIAPPREGWRFADVLHVAGDVSERNGGSVLLGIDAALGMPRPYFDAVSNLPAIGPAASFVQLLPRLAQLPRFFQPLAAAQPWHVEQPFFRVPPGKGSFAALVEQAGGRTMLWRDVDRQTGAKPLFAVSGIPGTVGCATMSLWRELSPLLAQLQRDVALWPFEGNLATLLGDRRIVLAEIYPRICPAVALAERLPANPAVYAKGTRTARAVVVNRLLQAAWLNEYGVVIEAQSLAVDSDDELDALISAAALLRLILNGSDPDDATLDTRAEGGILATPALAWPALAPR